MSDVDDDTIEMNEVFTAQEAAEQAARHRGGRVEPLGGDRWLVRWRVPIEVAALMAAVDGDG